MGHVHLAPTILILLVLAAFILYAWSRFRADREERQRAEDAATERARLIAERKAAAQRDFEARAERIGAAAADKVEPPKPPPVRSHHAKHK